MVEPSAATREDSRLNAGEVTEAEREAIGDDCHKVGNAAAELLEGGVPTRSVVIALEQSGLRSQKRSSVCRIGAIVEEIKLPRSARGATVLRDALPGGHSASTLSLEGPSTCPSGEGRGNEEDTGKMGGKPTGCWAHSTIPLFKSPHGGWWPPWGRGRRDHSGRRGR